MNTVVEQGTRETIEIFCELISTEMSAPVNAVQIYNQKRRLPTTKGYFVDVAIVGEHVFASNSRAAPQFANPELEDLLSTQTVNVQEMIQVDIFSYDDSARVRKYDLLFALSGDAAQRKAEQYAFKIARIPQSFVAASEVEASARLNRFSLTLLVLRAYERQKQIGSYTRFGIPPIVHTDPRPAHTPNQ